MSLNATIAVESRDLTSADISSALGCDPSDSQDVGALSRFGPVPRAWTTWTLNLSWRSDAHAGTAGLSEAVEALGAPFADRLAQLREHGCEVVLSVVQDLEDDPASTGLHLSAAAIDWLARARAVLDIDQYVRTADGG